MISFLLEPLDCECNNEKLINRLFFFNLICTIITDQPPPSYHLHQLDFLFNFPLLFVFRLQIRILFNGFHILVRNPSTFFSGLWYSLALVVSLSAYK